MKRRSCSWQLLAILIIGLSLSACGRESSEDASETVQSEPQPSATLSTPLTDPTTAKDSGESSSAATVQDGQVDVDQVGTSLPKNFDAMLDGIGDHQVEVSVSFEGYDQGGAPVTFEWLSRESVTIDPLGSRLDLEAVRGNEQGGIESMTLVRHGDNGYLYVPDVGCISGSAGDFAAAMILPLETATLLNGISGARPVGNGIVVNGVETTEFHFDETNVPWSPSGPWSITGNAFVEEGSDFLTRNMLNVSGNGDLLGNGRILDGEYTILINVTKGESIETIGIPVACLEAFRYPVTPDAFDVTAIEDLLSFRSRQSLVDVVDYYVGEMSDSGWQLLSEPDVFDDLAIMNYQRDGSPLMITIEHDSETNTVSVLISP